MYTIINSNLQITNNRGLFRHVLAKWPECHNLASNQMFLRKCQNRQFFDQKCTTLVTLVETGFQCYQIAGLPDMNIFGHILAILGFF